MWTTNDLKQAYDEEATAHTKDEAELQDIPMNMESNSDLKQPVTAGKKCFQWCSAAHSLVCLAILYILLMGGGILGSRYEEAQCGEGGCHSQDEDEYKHFGRALAILFSMGSLAVVSSVVSAGLVARYWRDLSPCALFLGIAPLLCSVTLLVVAFTY